MTTKEYLEIVKLSQEPEVCCMIDTILAHLRREQMICLAVLLEEALKLTDIERGVVN